MGLGSDQPTVCQADQGLVLHIGIALDSTDLGFFFGPLNQRTIFCMKATLSPYHWEGIIGLE